MATYKFQCARCSLPISTEMAGAVDMLHANPKIDYVRTTVECPNCYYENRILSDLHENEIRQQLVPCDEKDKRGPSFTVNRE